MTKRGTKASSMIAKGGMANFVRAVRFAARYSHQCDKAGRLLTLVEYQKASGLSRSMCFKEQKAWRRCFDENVGVLDVVSEAALEKKGWTEDERETAIARFLAES